MITNDCCYGKSTMKIRELPKISLRWSGAEHDRRSSLGEELTVSVILLSREGPRSVSRNALYVVLLGSTVNLMYDSYRVESG
jgi:hypothetical protein